ncbi:MAG TPA: hypothetical protein PKE64_20905, partial [Anaerolineae bacterium]|nr:hypothetical protein [Anaerolineae bacterium]
ENNPVGRGAWGVVPPIFIPPVVVPMGLSHSLKEVELRVNRPPPVERTGGALNVRGDRGGLSFGTG